MTEAKEKFPVMESEINHRATNFGVVLIWITVLLFAGIAMFWVNQLLRPDFLKYYSRNTLDLLASLIIIFLSAGTSFFLARFILTRKHNKYTVSVNDRGAFIFDRYGKISEQVLYTDLHTTTEKYDSDISLEFNMKINKQWFIIYKKTESNEVTKYNLSFQKDFYALKNNYELYQYFLRGVQIFRPDIKIQYHTALHFKIISPGEMTEKQKNRDKIFKIVFNIVLCIILLFFIYVIWMFIQIFSK